MTDFQAGPAQPVYIIDSSQLVENGGTFLVSGRRAIAITGDGSASSLWLTAAQTAVPDGADVLPDAIADGLWARRRAAGVGSWEAAEAAGAAATVQNNLTTHTGLTGTAVHGLGSASTLTAGATGAALVATATQDAARGVLGLAAASLPPRYVDHLLFAAAYFPSTSTGSGSRTLVPGVHLDLATGATANSTQRSASSTFFALQNSQRFEWQRKLEWSIYVIRVAANAQGVFRAYLGKLHSDVFGKAASGNYIGFQIENNVITGGFVCVSGTVTDVPLTTVTTDVYIHIVSENGTVQWYANGILIGSTTSGPTAAFQLGGISYEIENGADATAYTMRIVPRSVGH